jgi:N-acetylmuramoyl-L-alanine amidase
MPWSSQRPGGWPGASRRLPLLLAAMVVLISALFFSSARGSPAAAPSSTDEKRLSVYSTVANYSVSVNERNGQDYVGLLELLDPLGKVTARTDGKHWKVRYEDADTEFTPGKKGVRTSYSGFDLQGDFLLENGHGLVPLSSLAQLLTRILGGPVALHENSRRLFIGNVGVHFTAQVGKSSPPALIINFTAPVNPTIATESGKLHMHFNREALVAPGAPVLTFDSKIIPTASYEESNGTAEITVSGSAPLFAAFSDDRKTITITAIQQTAAQPTAAQSQPISTTPPTSAQPIAPQNAVTPGVVASPSPASSGTNLGQRKYFAVVDASHGGDERGATLNDQLGEKDVTLAFARQLRQQLENRGMATLLLRDGDINLSLDQRASQTNAAHPAIYLCIHAASQGSGIRLYTALLPPGGESRGPFIAWDTAQAGFISSSQSAAASVAVELRSKEILVRTLTAPLRPLNNINTVAIAVEIAPPGGKVSDLSSPDYQLLVATLVASGIADARPKLEAAP